MENLELFEKYINNELDDDARHTFEQRLDTDDYFKEAFEIFKEMHSYLDVKDDVKKGKENIILAKEKYISRKTNQRRLFFFFIATAVIIIIALLYQWTSSPNVSSQSLYAEFFTPEPLSVATLSSAEQNKAENGLKLFNQGDYNEAYKQLDTVGLFPRDKGVVLLGKGISALQDINVNEGRRILENLAKSYPIFANECNFYIALSYLKEDNLPSTESYLRRIPPSSNLYDTAQELLKKVEK